MTLNIEEPTTWWDYVNSPEQDPDLLAAEAYRISGVMVPMEMFTASICENHELILAMTADTLGMDQWEFMKLAQAGSILWQSPLLGKWVLVKGPGTDWLPAIGIQASVL